MSMIEIDAPATCGDTIKLRGERLGPFLLHKDAKFTLTNDGRVLSCWSLTHIKSGMRIPYSFPTKSGAKAFSKQALQVMDWEAIRCEPLGDGPKAKFVAGAPTDEQKLKLQALADIFAVK